MPPQPPLAAGLTEERTRAALGPGVHFHGRWVSCGKGGRLFFHWRTVLLPPPIIEYIVIHELVHLVEAHHTPAFWTRVERALPDFAARKEWLREKGATRGLNLLSAARRATERR